MDNKIIVTVQMITYKHDAFIKQAIEGVLMQETDFNFDLFVIDDCSPDNTPEIVNEIIKTHPQGYRIKYLRHETNLGVKRNGIFALSKYNGKYIALCEGDDYWTDKFKLQKQVDFLENHPECIICYTRAKVINERGEDTNLIIPSKKKIKKFSDFEDQLKENLVPTLTCVYRSGYLNKMPDFFYNHWCGDWILHLLNSQYGKIGFLNEITAAYRSHRNGISKKIGDIEKINSSIEAYKSLDNFLDYKYTKLINKLISRGYASLSKEYAIQNKSKESINYFIQGYKMAPINKYALIERGKALIALILPKLFKFARNLNTLQL